MLAGDGWGYFVVKTLILWSWEMMGEEEGAVCHCAPQDLAHRGGVPSWAKENSCTWAVGTTSSAAPVRQKPEGAPRREDGGCGKW